MERRALVFNIQKYNIYDGPGVRTIVFFKGCPLRCKWCSNPESQLRQYQVLFKQELCRNCGSCASVCPVGIHQMSADGIHQVTKDIECLGCRRCEESCPEKALAIVGQMKTISELIDVIEEDRPFYDSSGGGVTLGGGEVLMQPEAAVSLLTACKQRGIHTAIETCGYALPETVMQAAEVTDLFLFDVKHMDSARHYELTGVHNDRILHNLRWLLENRHDVRIRMPLIKGLNDDPGHFNALAQFLEPYRHNKNFKGIDILPYHRLGVYKYRQLGREYPVSGNPSLDSADLDRIVAQLERHGLPVTLVQH